jgi:hypothetical protein
MASRGFQYSVAVPDDVILEQAFSTAVEAGKTGAELDAAMEQAKNSLPPNPNGILLNNLPISKQAEWNSAYSGTDTVVGCAEADIAMSPEEAAALDTDFGKAEAAVAAAEQSPAGQEALRLWVQCMHDHGSTAPDVTNPDDWTASVTQRSDEMRTPEEEWPEPPASNASDTEKRFYEAQVGALQARDAAADRFDLQVEQLNEACLPAYDSFFDQAYQDAFN